MQIPAFRVLSVPVAAMCLFSVPVFAEDLPAAGINGVQFTDAMWDPKIAAEFAASKPKYIAADHIFTIEPAPANDSEITKQDLATLKKYEAERTAEQIEQIKNEVTSWEDLVLDASIPVDGRTFRDVARLVYDVGMEELYFSFVIKTQYKRPRPTQLDKSLSTVIPVPGHPAYPSAHGGQTYAAALALGYIDPENKDHYLQISQRIGTNRERAGVHYPSDTRGGQQLGEQVFAEMLKAPAFKKEIDRLAGKVRWAKTKQSWFKFLSGKGK